jgi:hypothetical protein
MRTHFVPFKAHHPDGSLQGGFAKGDFFRTIAGKNKLPFAGIGAQFFQNGKGLPAERHKMVAFHLHAICRNAPKVIVKIKLPPFRLTNFR